MPVKVPISIPKHDEEVLDIIEPYQKKRTLSDLVRSLLKLHKELSQGKTGLLFEMFPFMEDALRNQLCGDNQSEQTQSKGLTRTLPRQSISISDAPELEIRRVTKSEDSNASWNFLITSALTVYGDLGGLSQEIIDYGVRTKRIPESMVKSKPTPKGKAPKEMDSSGKKLEMPDFDDLEL